MSRSIPASGSHHHALGVAMVAASAVVWSTAGIFTKAVAADVWSILAWRGLFGAGFVLAYVVWREGRATGNRFQTLGWSGWTVATVSTVATIAFLSAFKLTTVANVVLIYATAPFVAAGMAWLWYRETASTTTLAASVVCLAGVGVIVSGSLGTPSLTGDLLALVMTFGMAMIMVLIRRFPDAPMVAAGCVSSLQLMIAGWLMSDAMSVPGDEITVLIGFGLVQAIGVILLTEGVRLIPASDAALLGTLEVPLAPVLAWLILSETVPGATITGGSIVAVALFWYLARAQETAV